MSVPGDNFPSNGPRPDWFYGNEATHESVVPGDSFGGTQTYFLEPANPIRADGMPYQKALEPANTPNDAAPQISPNPVACLACRNKHMKCDSAMPRCTRCREGGYDCVYLKSRRGYKGPRKSQKLAGSAAVVNSQNDGSPPKAYQPDWPISIKNGNKVAIPADVAYINAYFEHFHAAHPIVLPRPLFLQACAKGAGSAVLAIISYIGGMYAKVSGPVPMRELAAAAEAAIETTAIDGFHIQACLLYAIALHSIGDQSRSLELLHRTIDRALGIDMHHKAFAIVHGRGQRHFEESWRRTWWEIYVMDHMFASINQSVPKLSTIQSTALLPCEEMEYLHNKNLPAPTSLHEFNNRFFANEERVFSSFAYRIDVIRILGKIINVTSTDHSPYCAHVEDADTCLTSWSLDLPADKAKIVLDDGFVDEMLFQAHMIFNAASIKLHRPSSNLSFSSVIGKTYCTSSVRYSVPSAAAEIQTTKVIEAANSITKLIKLPTPLLNHTPMFTCAITLAAIIHLSVYALNQRSPESASTKRSLELSIAALKQFREVWEIAGAVLQQVRALSTDVFTLLGPREDQSAGQTTGCNPAPSHQDILAILDGSGPSWDDFTAMITSNEGYGDNDFAQLF